MVCGECWWLENSKDGLGAYLDPTLPTGFGLSTGHQSAISTPQRYNGALDHNPTQSYMFITAVRRLGVFSELI